MQTRLRLMGGFDLRDGDGAQVRLPTRKSLALLAFLTQSSGQDVDRGRLAALLWPRADEAQARASLRQELAVLRKALAGSGLPEIDANKETLRFDLPMAQADSVKLAALSRSGGPAALREVGELYRGEFLEDLNIRSGTFDEWVWIERQQLRDAAITALARLLQLDREAGSLGDVIGTAQALLRADPTNEAAALSLMAALRDTGRRTDALQQFQRFRDVLRRELDADPSASVSDLAEEIRLSSGPSVDTGQRRREGVAASITRRLTRFPAPVLRERRKATLAVLGLAGVSDLGANYDAPELAAAQELFVQRAAALIDDYGGSYMPCAGDRILACFGYPTADEHDSERAVLASLGVVAEPVRLASGGNLWPRAAIARGDTLISPPGPDRNDVALAGVAVHIAGRLEQLAHGRQVLVSPETHGLVRRAFETVPLPGTDGGAPQAHMIRRERIRSNRFDVRKLSARLTPLIGRDEAMAELRQAWVGARRGQGQAVTVTGEPGLGKSRLVHAFLQSVLGENPGVIQLGASPLHRQSALFAIVQFLEEDAGLDRIAEPAERQARLSLWAADMGLAVEEVVPPLFALLSGPVDEGLPEPGRGHLPEKGRLFAAIVAAIRARSVARPLVVLIEDLHWLDPMSGEFLRYLLPRIQSAPILVLMTARPEVAKGWTERLPGRRVALDRLTPAQARAVVSDLLPAGTSRARFDAVVERADGIPLYLEELAKSVAESDADAASGGAPPPLIPDSLEASLLARIDRLDSAREVLQVASVFGKVFDQQHLRTAMGLSPEILETRLRQLQEADLVYRVGRAPNARYEFKHVLVQELTYRALPPDRRTASHRQIAEALVREAGRGGPKSPEIVARHFAKAGQTRKAIEHFESAGKLAARVSAHQEAATHFRAALALLPDLAEGAARSRLELTLLLHLGPHVLATQGFAAQDVAQIYERARALVVDTATRAAPEMRDRILWGLWGYFLVRGDISASYGLGAEFLANAREQDDPVSIVAGNQMLGLCSFYRGKLAQALDYLEKARALYTEDQAEVHLRRYGLNLSVAAWSYLSWTCALRGDVRRAGMECQRNLMEADRLRHDFSQVVARVFATGTYLFLGDEAQAAPHEQLAADLPELRRFSQMRAQALLQSGRLADRRGDRSGLATLREGLEAYQATGAALAVPHGKAWVAEALAADGALEDALETVGEALAHSARTGVRFFDAELYRLRGLFLERLHPQMPERAETAFDAALEAARDTGCALFQMRAAADFAALCLKQSRKADALRILQAAEIAVAAEPPEDFPEARRIKALLAQVTQ